MKTAKLFQNGQSQAVRLPKDFRFQGKEVYIKKVGEMTILYPVKNPWDVLYQSLTMFSDDFMETRVQPKQQHREDVF
jgi:antitoxin VapB